jgi:hypothetical protein
MALFFDRALSTLVETRGDLNAFEARVRALELDQTDYDGYGAAARVHLRDLMAAYAQSAAPLQAPVMLGTIVLTAAPALGASEGERFEAGKTAAVDVSTAAGAGAAQGSTDSSAGTGMAQDGVDAMKAVTRGA